MRLLVTADTHTESFDGIPVPVVDAAEEADAVVHAGDFTAPEVLEGFEGTAPVHAVYGNADTPDVCDALSRRAVFEAEGVRVCVVHGHQAADVAYEAAETGADIVVRGHTHTPLYKNRAVPVLNPGSPTRPRGSSSSYYAWLVCENGRYTGRVVSLGGETLVEFGEE